MTTPMTYGEWADQFHLTRKATRALWIAIMMEFERQQPPMTVRQMFYRMSAQNIVPKTESGYDKVGYALKNMRLEGAIPFEWIADNTRWMRKPRTHSDMATMLAESARFYRRDLWANQPDYVEIWLEKDALAGVVYDVTSEFDVPLYVSRGYSSVSYVYAAAEALKAIDKPKYIYHLGDYDASGKDAARDIQEKLWKFGADFEFIEIAVTDEQIDLFNLQTRPPKPKDSRAKQWGDKQAVELDAIPPSMLRRLVRDVIEQHIDQGELQRLKAIEAQEKATLDKLITDFWSSLKAA
jgi:hypothetical protein